MSFFFEIIFRKSIVPIVFTMSIEAVFLEEIVLEIFIKNFIRVIQHMNICTKKNTARKGAFCGVWISEQEDRTQAL